MPAVSKVNPTRAQRWAWCAALVCLSAIILRTQSSSGRYITVEWDPSPDERVVGYVVYVGTQSGRYNESFVVRNRTYFVYPNALPDRRYYFAVAAYAGGPLVGGPSEEVSGYGQSTPALSTVDDLAVQEQSTGVTPQSASRGDACAEFASANCYHTAVVATIAASVGALAATGDGRLLMVEDGQRIGVLDGNTVMSEAALITPRSTVSFVGIAVDPRFEQDRHVFIAEAERLADGTRELSIVRYRDVQNALGERAVIVAGLRLSATGFAPFTVDSTGRIFIAMPESPTPYSGFLLGFESDGGALQENRAASPVVAHGFARPTAILWDAVAQQLWSSGVDEHVSSTVLRVPLNALTSSDVWPRVPQNALVVSHGRGVDRFSSRQNGDNLPMMLLPLPGGQSVVRLGPGVDSVTELPDITEGQMTATTTAPPYKSAYIAIRVPLGDRSQIVRIDAFQR